MLKIASFVVSLSVAMSLAGCGPEPAPDVPTYNRDVKPLLLSRCVRCHGAGGTLNADPAIAPRVPIRGYFDHYEDQDCTPGADGGAQTCAKQGAASFATSFPFYIRLPADMGRMPPAPAPALTDRQIEILTRWSMEMPPREN